MRCMSCNVALTDAESVRKNKATGEYYDLCRDCYQAYKQNLITLEDKFVVDYSQSETQENR